MQSLGGRQEIGMAKKAKTVETLVAGEQEPRICSYPEADTSIGKEAVELAASAGLVLDDWESYVRQFPRP